MDQSHRLIVFSAFQLFFLICLARAVQSLDLSQCTMPLGMESGEIPDTDITASTSFEHGNVGPHIGRVRQENQGGAWCPKNPVTSEPMEWLQIDLHSTRVITMTETQGRFGNGQGQEFAENYVISYWRPQLNKWVRYRDNTGNEILKGNINTYLASKTQLNPPIIASKIRFIPYSHHRRTVCMRVEIYGCVYRGGLLSYSMPQGSKRGENWELYDQTYDGQWDGHYLKDGLGQLTDGKVGPINFKDDFYGPERGKGWVGWKNESRNATSPLEILFSFDSPREFNTAYIHTSNQFTKDIQVFSEARVFFSVGGKLFSGDPILYVPVEDFIFEDPKNVSIKLHHRIGQYVKIQLFWASKWILISEITFASQPAMGNFTEEGTGMAKKNDSQESLDVPNDVSRVVIDNPVLPINVGNSIMDQVPTVTEQDFNYSSTVVLTAVISSCIAVIFVLLIIFAAFLMRHRLFTHEKVPPPGINGGSVHYANTGLGSGGPNGCPSEFGYAAPLILFPARDSQLDPKSNSPPTMASSLSRDYEPSKPSFSSFVGSNGNNLAYPTTKSTSSEHSKLTEYYSSAQVVHPNNSAFYNNIPPSGLKTNEYEYVTRESDSKHFPSCSQKSPAKRTSGGGGATTNNNPSFSPLPTSRKLFSLLKRVKELDLPEIPKTHVKVLRKLGEGMFGTICIAEVQQLPHNPHKRQLVSVKRLLPNATEKDKLDFIEEVRLLSSLKDPNVVQVIGLCTEEEPLSVLLEFLEMGDLCQFLRGHDALCSPSNQRISFGDLLHLAAQVASGMKFLESKNIVHRDLAARNCVVSRCWKVKISHFATDTGLYASDYSSIDGKPLPLRWMAWESVFIGKYSTKSDVWSFGVTLWEILTFCRQSPYPAFTDQDVIANLRQLSLLHEEDGFVTLNHPYNCPRDVFELMCDAWRRNDEERPSFWEIHCFLMRKNLNYANVTTTVSSHHSTNINHDSTDLTSYFV